MVFLMYGWSAVTWADSAAGLYSLHIENYILIPITVGPRLDAFPVGHGRRAGLSMHIE